MKPRSRPFKKRDNKLRLAFIQNKDYGKDFIGTVPADEEGRWDLYLLFRILLSEWINPRYEKNEETGKYEETVPVSIVEELENRGYDIRTLYFEIEKQNKEEPYEKRANKIGFRWGSVPDTNHKKWMSISEQVAFNIIKKKRVNVLLLDGCDTLEQYNHSVDLIEIPKDDREKYHLSQREFETLKERLGNGEN